MDPLLLLRTVPLVLSGATHHTIFHRLGEERSSGSVVGPLFLPRPLPPPMAQFWPYRYPRKGRGGMNVPITLAAWSPLPVTHVATLPPPTEEVLWLRPMPCWLPPNVWSSKQGPQMSWGSYLYISMIYQCICNWYTPKKQRLKWLTKKIIFRNQISHVLISLSKTISIKPATFLWITFAHSVKKILR